jgi:adenylate cyclase
MELCRMLVSAASPLQSIEPRLRAVLPADLYAAAWLDPSVKTLQAVFEHLRSLRRILHSYVPQHVARSLARPGDVRFDWQTGSLMFTDLAGFTSLMEAAARSGPSGAQILLAILKAYFARMIEIIETSGGTLLEFTGDALLAAFLPDGRRNDTAQAVRAGLRMQRAMAAFSRLDTSFGAFSLDMRVGIHAGRFLRADIGTPRRMDHVLLGHDVQVAKLTESRGQRGRVNLSAVARNRVDERFRFEHGEGDDHFVVDDLDEAELGAFDLALTTRRLGAQILFDRSIDGLVSEITAGLELIEPLAAYVPTPVLNLLVENTARREVPPDFQSPTIVFVNLIGLSEAIDRSDVGETTALIVTLSRIFTLINAAVEARGGVLKKVTYQLNGSDILIFFGTPHAHSDDPIRAADAALAIRAIVDARRACRRRARRRFAPASASPAGLCSRARSASPADVASSTSWAMP